MTVLSTKYIFMNPKDCLKVGRNFYNIQGSKNLKI